ncbi:hypothetical protein [Novosphingobium sp.]|uniref:hypothetical protein n=1 Tax=Novosphingobium sp. TaxID=1874826 RepID=UPI00262D1264|nr:hypothetical protein [Novosphingobium sp.]
MAEHTFEKRRALSLAILTKGERLTRKSGSFLGQLIVDPTPMTPAQTDWFNTLVERAGLASDGGADV